MIFCVERTFIIAAISFLNIKLYSCACARAEYEINGECCPMCSSGNRVDRHCTEFSSTTCLPCIGLTYTDEPNGFPECLNCTVCHAGQGLRVKTACKRTSDTVCEPLEGFYCTDKYKASCRYAVEHTKCSPGQYIKQNGTTDKDAECADCLDGTYSNGTLQVCKQHTKCEDLGRVEKTPGTKSSDAECESKTSGTLVIVITIVTVAVVAALVPSAVLIYKRTAKKCPTRGVPPSLDEKKHLKNPDTDTPPASTSSMSSTNSSPISTSTLLVNSTNGSLC